MIFDSASAEERTQGLGCTQSLSEDEASTASSHSLGNAARILPSTDALEAVVNATAIKNAVRLQPLGYRPGMMSGRVGLLEGLRSSDMDKYDEVGVNERGPRSCEWDPSS